MTSLAEAIAGFLGAYKPLSTGITEDENITFSTERYMVYNNKHRIHIIVETKLEDLDEALQKALDEEDYHTAGKLEDLIQKRKSNPDPEDEED